MKYPAMPPTTELMVQIIAYNHAFARFAIIIGINSISGGIGKKELSEKEIIERNQEAFG